MLYVIIQFSLLFYMGYNTDWTKSNYISLILFCLSISLGLWALFSMGLKNLSVFPNPKKNAEMQIRGPYRLIRHPMYTAVLLFSIAMYFMKPSWYMFVALMFLLVDLIFKLRFEERLLMQKFQDYNTYKKTTYCLIPFIY